MKALGIDPGTNSLGWFVLSEEEIFDYGALQFEKEEPLLDRLNSIYLHLFRLLSDHTPDILALEKTWRVDRGSLSLVAAIKIMKETAELVEGLSVKQITAVSARKHFGVGARSSEVAKERVKGFVMDELGLEDGLVSDIYDAALIALWGIDAT